LLIRATAFHWRKIFAAIMIFGPLLVLGQHCSRANLEEFHSYSFSSTKAASAFVIKPPSDYVPQRRYVLLVDMSNSMISAPCPQDVDANLLFSSTSNFTVYDPNKNVGDPNDHRASGVDCMIDRNLPISRAAISLTLPNLNLSPPASFVTPLGMDHEGDRFTIIEKWLQSAIQSTTPAMRDNFKVLILPITGGSAQLKLNEALRIKVPSAGKFLRLSDPALMATLNFLKSEQVRNLQVQQNAAELVRYQQTNMGTSSFGENMQPTFNHVREDMKDLYKQGLLSVGEYEVAMISDGKMTPVTDNIKKVLNTFHQCSACANNINSCTSVCSLLVQKMEKAWGQASANTVENMDFFVGLMQSLPEYFGAGDLRMDLLQLKKQRFLDLNPGTPSFLDQLRDLVMARNHTINLWQVDADEPPFYPTGSQTGSLAFKVTHFFILNPNARLDANGQMQVDSDGDGISDNDEIAAGLNPDLSRTNGYCLDGLRINATFNLRCQALADSKSCDATLDSDGDSLNECEESILGTDPYDFDTDGDGIPDSLELVYQYNPLVNDSTLDSNGDGMPNAVHFAHGLGPNVSLNQIPDALRLTFEVNNQGRSPYQDPLLGSVWVDLVQVILRQIPLVNTRGASFSAQVPLYVARAGLYPGLEARNLISNEHQLISVSGRPGNNQVLAITRMIDVNDARRAYWRVLKWNLFVNSVILESSIDLSQFQQIRATDRN